jgi:hypothetical protein
MLSASQILQIQKVHTSYQKYISDKNRKLRRKDIIKYCMVSTTASITYCRVNAEKTSFHTLTLFEEEKPNNILGRGFYEINIGKST